MKKVLIVGSGGQGGPCASILARDKDVTEIVLGDIDLELAKRVKSKIKSDKITAVKLDAGKVEDIKNAAKGADIIINLALIIFNDNIMRVALESGAHYVDTATGEPIWTQLTKGQPLALDDEFRRAGLTALIACGGTPGLTNVLIRYTCDKLDRVDEIRIRMGGRPLEKPKDVVRAWEPGWCPEVALTDYGLPPGGFENGKPQVHPIFSGYEEYVFPDPVGTVPVTHHAHEEPVTLPRFIGKGIKYCDFKYPIDTIAGAMVKMGFAKREPVDVKGVKVKPLDVVMALVRRPVNTFLSEDETTVSRPAASIHCRVMEIKGAKAGEDVTYKLIQFSATPEENLRLYRQFGTARIGVALTAIIGARMCVAGEAERGLIAPECLDAKKFLKRMADAGAPVQFEEICSKEVSVC